MLDHQSSVIGAQTLKSSSGPIGRAIETAQVVRETRMRVEGIVGRILGPTPTLGREDSEKQHDGLFGQLADADAGARADLAALHEALDRLESAL